MKKIAIVFLSLISLTAFSQKPTGKIVIKSGQHFVVESSSDMVVNQEMMGQSMEMKIATNTKINAEITDNKDNNYTITQTLTNVKSKFSGMGQDKTFDSDKKEDMDSEAGAIFKDKLNVPTTIIVSNEGKTITSTDTTKAAPDANPMSAMMDMMGTGQDISAALFLVIPAGKKSGDTWQDSTSKEGVKLKRTFTLNSITNKEASVTVDGVLDINKKVQVQGMDMNAVMVSKISSAVLVDIITNIQKENKSTTDVTGTIDIMGQSVPMTSKVTTVVTVKGI